MAGLIERQNGRGLKRLSVAKITGNGAVSVDVAGRDAIELTLDGDGTIGSWSGWTANTDLHQQVTVTVKQDAVGGRLFDVAGTATGGAVWQFNPPTVFDTEPGDVSLILIAETYDAGATVRLHAQISEEDPAPVMSMGCATLPFSAIAANSTFELDHGMDPLVSIELHNTLTGERSRPDSSHQTPGDLSSPLDIAFVSSHVAGEIEAVISGKCLQRPQVQVRRSSLWQYFDVDLLNETSANVRITTDDTEAEVIWGDGTAPEPLPSTSHVSHTYGSAYTGPVRVRWRPGRTVTQFESTVGRWDFDIAVLPATLNRLTLISPTNQVRGKLAVLPDLVDYIGWGAHSIDGQYSLLNPNMVRFYNLSLNARGGGNIADIPRTVTFFRDAASVNAFGSVTDIPAGAAVFALDATNSLEGDISNVPASATTLIVGVDNLLTGDLSAFVQRAGLALYTNNGNAVTVGATFAPVPTLLEFRIAGGTPYTSAEVDLILQGFDAAGGNNGTIDINGSAAPSAAGAAAIANLTAAGRDWSVTA